jgi:hypothetical protein
MLLHMYSIKRVHPSEDEINNKLTPFIQYFLLPYQTLYTEASSSANSQYYAQKPQRNCTFMNSASGEVATCTTRMYCIGWEKHTEEVHCKKEVSCFPVPSRDVFYQTPPDRE